MKKGDLTADNQVLSHTLFSVIPDDRCHSGVKQFADHVHQQFPGLRGETCSILFKAFPFHVIFDRDMKIIQVGFTFELRNFSWMFGLFQVGYTLARVFDTLLNQDCYMSQVFEMIRPYMKMTYMNIVEHLNSIFVFQVKIPVVDSDGKEFKK